MADLYIQRKYIQKISNQLQLFEKKRKDLWCCRCPICGDSKKNQYKKRFYIFLQNDTYMVKCHNCSYTQSFKNFLNEFDLEIYKHYILEDFGSVKNKRNQNKINISDLKNISDSNRIKGFSYEDLIRFEDLSPKHPARLYVETRKIPFDKVLYCSKFSDFINTLSIEHYKISYNNSNEPRLIIPFYRKDGLSTVFQARAFSSKESLRYITIKENEHQHKIFGLDCVDDTKPVYIFEGPIDAMMIKNSIAMSGISLGVDLLFDKVFIFDNEPRNKYVVNNMLKQLIAGNNVVIFPERIVYKDINDMIVKGNMTSENVIDIIENNIYNGSIGMLKLSNWRK